MNIPSKRKKVIKRLVVGGVLAVILLNPFSLRVYGSLYAEYMKGKMLSDRNVYGPIRNALALYCQSYPLLESLFKPENKRIIIREVTDFAWMPKEMRVLGLGSYGDLIVCSNSSSVAIGDGYTEDGYTLSLDTEASTSTTNVWKLSLRRQGFFSTSLRHLETFPMDATRQLAPDGLLARLVAECDVIIHDAVGVHIESRRRDAWVKKIRIYLMFGRFEEAQATYQEMCDVISKKCKDVTQYGGIPEIEKELEAWDQTLKDRP